MNTKTDLYNGDCLEIMKDIPDKSIDMILTDLPYGITASSWDKNLNSKAMWSEYERIIKNNAAIVLFSSGKYTIQLINSNLKLYKYKWIWEKNTKGNFVNAKNRPMTSYEEILIFSKGGTANGSKNKMKYYPQGLVEVNKLITNGESKFGTIAGKRPSHKKETFQKYTNYPDEILKYDVATNNFHTNEKPVDLLEYLIKTYTNEDEIVLDSCMGSGSTGVACKNTSRNFIGIELDEDYFNIAKERIENYKNRQY